MATYELKRFARIHVLRAIKPLHLAEFFEPFGEYFSDREFDLRRISDDMSAQDVNDMLCVLMNPDTDTPQRLIDALFHVNEMATQEGMEILLAEYGKAGYVFPDPDPTPADIAVCAWTMNSRLFETTYARLSRLKPRTYHCYQGSPHGNGIKSLDEEALIELENDLNDWAEKNKLGRYCKVFLFPGEQDHCYIVRRGKPHARVSTIKKGESSCAFFQPEAFDPVTYDPVMDRLRVGATTKGTQQLYRTAFGKHLFGDDQCFEESPVFYLQPLLTEGRECLCCDDIPGMSEVRLTKIEVSTGGGDRSSLVWKGPDVYDNPDFLEHTAPDAEIIMASFAVKYYGSKRSRTSDVRPPNSVKYHRDGDCRIFEDWLRKRKMLKGHDSVQRSE